MVAGFWKARALRAEAMLIFALIGGIMIGMGLSAFLHLLVCA